MGSSSPDLPDPAKRPERIIETDPEDIEIGTSEQTEGTDLLTQGKRSLTRPSGGSPTSGINI